MTSMTPAQAAQQNNRGRAGRYKNKQYSEPEKGLSGYPGPRPEMPTDLTSTEIGALATVQLGDRIRSEAAGELREWRGNHWMHSTVGFGPKAPLPIRERVKEAAGFETLSKVRQRELVGEQLAHMLDDNQQFGTDRIHLKDGFKPSPESVMVGLSAQRRVEQSGIPGEITFMKVADGVAHFSVVDQGLTHGVSFSQSTATFHRDITQSPGAPWTGWLGRANNSHVVTGSSRTDLHTEQPEYFGRDYEEHHRQAMLYDTVSHSPLRAASEHFRSMDLNTRSATFNRGYDSYTVNLQGENPVVTDKEGTQKGQEFAATALDELAAATGHSTREELCESLVQIFEDSDLRLQR